MMTPSYKSIKEILGKGVYTVPVYQRPYSWDFKIIDVLMKDLWNCYTSGKEDLKYYTGNIMVSDTGIKVSGLPKYDVIDGQQRITTFVIISMVLYCLLLEYGCKETNPVFTALKSCLWKDENGEWKKEARAISLNSVEKLTFSELYDSCFNDPAGVKNFCEIRKNATKSVIEKRVFDNFLHIYDFFKTEKDVNDLTQVLMFADFFMKKVYLISVDSEYTKKETFSIFESLNGKGKKLEEIDLIKSYIFSQLDEQDYDEYLKIWGNLIISTHDMLEDYLYTYIRAYVFYYKVALKKDLFQSLNTYLTKLFGTTTLREALKALLKDLQNKVNYYNALYDSEKAYEIVKYDKFRFVFEIFVRVGYQHPKPLFFRILTEYGEHKITKDDAYDIVRESLAFMVKFLTISDRDSKDALSLFSNIMGNIRNNNGIVKENIVTLIANELYDKSVTDEDVTERMKVKDFYSQNRYVGLAFLSFYQSQNKNNANVSYDKAYGYMKEYGILNSIDHILPQTPSSEFSYSQNILSDVNVTLLLKQGSDFPDDIVEGMDYELFTSKCLNKLGNLRIISQSENSAKNNEIISEIEGYGPFYKYSQICHRTEIIANFVVKNLLFNSPVNLEKNLKQRKKPMSKLQMKDLIEMGLVQTGNELYIKVRPEALHAKLVSDKQVEVQGKKYTVNQWAKNVTGWSSINIYEYVCVVGEDESLGDKRDKILNM